ncbi:Dimethylglycine oxidase [Halomonadaceae bacterium LMG 33818]|uniref:GcvT family protein n=1 Tax=Cernens ardua TaxID=3402176 RepID=UPI003EDB8497
MTMEKARASAHKDQPRIVIIGLGVVGAALADELTQRGMQHVSVFEQGPLYETGGSSSHAPGFVFQTTANKTMTELATRTLDKLDGKSLDGKFLAKRIGGLELATTPARWAELKRRHGLATAWGVPSRLITAEECAELWPGLNTEVVLGGFLTPNDAIVKGVRAVEWQARRAEEHGAVIQGHTEIVDILRNETGKVTGVKIRPTPTGPDDAVSEEVTTVDADIVIACAGLWGPGVAKRFLGFELPMLPIEHCFGYSHQVPSLEGVNDEIDEAKRPMLRHQDFAMYLREFNDVIGIGAYEHRSIGLEQDQISSPEEFAKSGVHPAMHTLTWPDFEPTWKEAQKLLPELTDVGFDHGFNGIFSFTPDGGPLMGPVEGSEGLWMAQAVWVTQSAGVAQVMADWIVTGDPGIDTHGLDYTRFDPHIVTHAYTVGRGEEAYDEVYDIRHPHQSTQILRGSRTSPFYLRHEALGAVFGEANGWERPLWFESNRALLDSLDNLPERDDWAATDWSPIAAAEAKATREGVALYDMSSLMRLEVEGPGVVEFLQGLMSNKMDKSIGSVTYSLMLDEAGGILSDVTVTRMSEECYQLGVNGHMDEAYLKARLPKDSSIRIRDLTPGTCGIGLWGPHARDVLGKLTRDDISHTGLKYFRAAEIEVAGVKVLALRVSYVGELGWELYCTADNGLYLWDQLWAAGQPFNIIAAGRRAFNSLRLEKGYRSFGTDMTREHSPEEAGIGFAVRFDSGDFVGREALEKREVVRRLSCLTLDDATAVVLGNEPVFDVGGTEAIGYVTSADQSYTLGVTIAYAWLPADRAVPDEKVEIEYFGDRYVATVRSEPLFDPDMTHIRR